MLTEQSHFRSCVAAGELLHNMVLLPERGRTSHRMCNILPMKRANLHNGAASFSRKTFPCCVWHFVFCKWRWVAVFLTKLFVSGERTITSGSQVFIFAHEGDVGKWRECSTVSSAKGGKSARNIGIDLADLHKMAPGAGDGTPFLVIQ